MGSIEEDRIAKLEQGLSAFCHFANDIQGQDCIVMGSAPNPDLGENPFERQIICCNGAALTLQEHFGRSPNFTFLHSHVPFRQDNPADKDVMDALVRVKRLGRMVVLYHYKHKYDRQIFADKRDDFCELNWKYRFEIFRRLTGCSLPFLDVSTGATTVAACILAGARSIRLVGFSFAQKGHSYNNKNLHRAHISSDAALYCLLHASGYEISATDPSVAMVLMGKRA
jgi:hypothetical protein